MQTLARTVRSLALIFWLGGILFFGAVVAPRAFQILGKSAEFGTFIGACLLLLHSAGLWCGVAIIVALRLLGRHARWGHLQIALAFGMMLLTFLSNRYILAPMEHDRALAGGQIEALMPGSPLRNDFEARHRWSTTLEGAVLLLGLGLVGIAASEREQVLVVERDTVSPPVVRRPLGLD